MQLDLDLPDFTACEGPSGLADLCSDRLESGFFKPEIDCGLAAFGPSASVPDVAALWWPKRKGQPPRFQQGYDVRPLRRLGQSMLAQSIADLQDWEDPEHVDEALNWLNEGPAAYPFALVAQLLGVPASALREGIAARCPRVRAVGPKSVLRRASTQRK